MKNSSRLIAFTILSAFSGQAIAAAPSSITLDTATLRTQLLQSNLSLEQKQKSVEDAKTTVALARASLFPSINVSALFNGGFAVSSVEFLLPFLIPSNWSELDQDKHLFEAEKLSCHALELDTLSSALSLYFNVRTDQEIAQHYLQQAKDLREIGNYIQNAANYGLASAQEVQNALGNAEAAEGQASQMNAAMVKEVAALRQALGLSLETQILFSSEPSSASVPPSDVEPFVSPSDIEKTVQRALAVAPEQAQMAELLEAANAGRWKKLFGWINSASISTTAAQAGSSASFSKLQAKGSVSLGLGLFPAIELSNRNVEEMQLRAKELEQETTQILEGSLLAIREAQGGLDHFQRAETALKDAYESTLQQYQFGVASLYDVLQAHQNLSGAAIRRVQAELDLTLLRVTLHRTLLTDEFSKVQNCEAYSLSPPAKKPAGLIDWFRGLFGSDGS